VNAGHPAVVRERTREGTNNGKSGRGVFRADPGGLDRIQGDRPPAITPARDCAESLRISPYSTLFGRSWRGSPVAREEREAKL